MTTRPRSAPHPASRPAPSGLTHVKATSRPTRLGWLPLVAAPVLGVLSVMTVDSWLLLLAGASLGLGVAAILLRPRLRDLEVQVQVPARADLGAAVTTRVLVRNVGRRSSPLSTLTHSVAGLADLTLVLEALAPGASAEMTVSRLAVERGRAATGAVLLASSAPLGLVLTTAIGTVATPVTVHPALLPVRLPVPRTPGTDTASATPDRSGLDVHGIREWRPGDEARSVHWRSTARRGRLVVLEREAPHGGALSVLVAGALAQPGFEPLVSVVASTGVAALAAGYTVSIFAGPSGTALLDVRGGQRTELLDWCAGIQPHGVPDRATVEAAMAKAGRGGVLHLATTGPPLPWRDLVRSLAAASGVELAPLPGPRP